MNRKPRDNNESARSPDEDIIQLLNTKKKPSREILSITNAAASALSSGAQSRQASVESYSSQNYVEDKENYAGDGNVSLVSTGDGSFSGQQRVRVPSRLLREIKSPDRSTSENVSSSESRKTSSGSLFASQSSSEHSSVQTTGPIPTVIKYSSDPLQQPHTSPSRSEKDRQSDTPVVIKYLQEYTSPNSKNSSSSSTGKLSGTGNENSTTTPIVKRHQPEVHVMESKNKRAGNIEVLQGSEPSEKKVEGVSVKEPVKMKGAGLCQGAPSNNLSYVAESGKGQVKAVSFRTSEKGKATRNMLTKRQENCPAVRRVIQPKLVEEQSITEGQDSNKEKNVAQDKTSEKQPVVQFPDELEERVNDLMNALGAIENQCQENRAWQEKQQQELEKSIKERDERRLQHLEETQKQLVEYQLKYAQPVSAMSHHKYPSTTGCTIQGLSATQVAPAALLARDIQPRSGVQTSQNDAPSQNLLQGLSNPSYTPAVQHKTRPSFQTTVYGTKPREERPNLGVKRKLVRNTRTQTSPQVSSSPVPSSESSSLLDTPLPRKKYPVPITRDWKADRGEKHVRFDSPDDKNIGSSSKKKVDACPLQIGNSEMKNHNGKSTHEYGRQKATVLPRSGQTHHIVNDIGRLRQELRDALDETEQTKLSLKNLDDRIHSQISSDAESVVAVPDHTRPYPLDAYLRATRDVPEELSTTKLERDLQTDSRREVAEPESGLCTYALSVLHDVQKRKENLEWNLMALTRHHKEQYLYNMTEDDETNCEVARIRQDVAKKIDEIDLVVQAELLHEKQQRALENQVSAERSKPTKQAPRGIPSSMERRAKLRTIGKENTQQSRVKAAVKPKITKPSPKQAAVKRPHEDVTYVSRGNGKADHVTRGAITAKPEETRYQASGAVKPKRNATTARYKPRSPRKLDEYSSTTSEEYPQSIRRTSVRNSRYYFQPNVDESVVDAHFKNSQGRLPGQLLPMAIPLGKPRMDPALRLPLSMDDNKSRAPVQTVMVSSDVKQPNVAVITVKDQQCDSESVKIQQKSASKKKRGKVNLEKQVLPSVDIDTSAASDVSSDVVVYDKETRTTLEPTIVPLPDPLSRPNASEYEEFNDYEHVRTVGEDEECERSSSHGEETVISLHGENRTDKPAYQGPAFPPQNIPMDTQDHGGYRGTLEDLRTPSEAVEHKARELIEQELLARVVSEMAPPQLDPTSVMRRSNSSQSLGSSETEPDLAAAIGLRGIQLFVDAGIPVDTELVRSLIMEALQEKVTTMLGYPKPQENIPLSTTELEVDHIEPESGSEDISRVQTPIRTPSAASVPESQPLMNVSTPEQTQDSLTHSTSDDVISKDVNDIMSGHAIHDKHSDDIEEGLLDDTTQRSPVATPVATPSPPQSVTSLPTPEVSEREKTESTDKSSVETPEKTVSIRDETPEERPVEDNDLKEQTLVEDDKERFGTDIPAIKFELKPELSEAKTTNSPSSITTTTYSTQSTLGTMATDDEISEGEQLQPFVHVGQYSEGEFVAISGITGLENMTTLHEIPDDILDSFSNTNRRPDPVKQAVHGLLKLDDISDESTRTSEETAISEGQQQLVPTEPLAKNVAQEDASEGEVVGGASDAVITLLTRIRQSVWGRRPTEDNGSVGEAHVADARSSSRRLEPSHADVNNMSPGELKTPDHGEVRLEAVTRLDRSSLFSSDENNNDSQQNSSADEIPNETWDSNVTMVTPKKIEAPFSQRQAYPSSPEQTAPADIELKTFPRVVRVAEAPHVSTPTELSLSPEQRPGSKGSVTMEALSEIKNNAHSDHVSDQVNDHMSDHMTDQRIRIQLTLPSAEPSDNMSLMSEGLLGSEESAKEISSISGGEISL